MTIKDIARLANVSVATVSKVINGKAESISSETKAKIFAIIKRENCVPYKKAIDRANRNKAINSVLSLEHVKMMLFYRNHPFKLDRSHISKTVYERYVTVRFNNRMKGAIYGFAK